MKAPTSLGLYGIYIRYHIQISLSAQHRKFWITITFSISIFIPKYKYFKIPIYWFKIPPGTYYFALTSPALGNIILKDIHVHKGFLLV